MSEIRAIDDEYVTLRYYPETGIVHHTYHKLIGGEAFRTVLLKGVDLLRQYGGTKWLSDNRGSSNLAPEDNTWAMTVWFPQAKAAGWKVWALVVPEDIMVRMSLKDFVDDYYEKGLRIMVFTSPEEALSWLEAVKI